MRSMVVGVSSTTSCSMPATRHTTSSFMSASTLATARGCDTKGSPEILVWALCSEALNSYAFRSRLRSSPGRETWTFRTISSNCNIPTRFHCRVRAECSSSGLHQAAHPAVEFERGPQRLAEGHGAKSVEQREAENEAGLSLFQILW